MQPDYFTILTNVISEASNDPAQLRKLVYSLAWLKTENLLSLPGHSASGNINALLKLERTLALDEAISRIEAIAQSERRWLGDTAEESEIGDLLRHTEHANPLAPREKWDDSTHAADPRQMLGHSVRDLPVIIPPNQPPIRLSQLYGFATEWWPHRSDPAHSAPSDAPRRENSRWIRPGLLSFAQLVAAVVFGVALYIGVAGWVQIGHQSASSATHHGGPTAAAALSSADNSGVPAGVQRTVQTSPPRPKLPFPVPQSFGVYVIAGKELIELTQLPIKIPDPRVLVSAEISKASHATVPDGHVKFIVFRRDLVNSSPSAATVRVVARVTRDMKFVEGKPTYTALDHSWRVRAKSFDFTVAPVEGRPDMIIMRPIDGSELPAGRYALVLDGYGYDFTVAGKVTSADQCLEQVEVLNGAVLSPCPTKE
jgi:hypothetical protein